MLFLLMPALAAGAVPITPEVEGNCQSPNWSLDGSQLAYEVNFHEDKRVELYIYKPGSSPVRVQPVGKGATGITSGFSGPADQSVVHELSWSPAVINSYVYAASGTDRDYEIYLSGGSAISKSPAADGGAAWSPDGHWIGFTSARTGQGDVYLLDVFDLEKAPVRLTTDDTASELYIRWAPDSTRMAYVGHTSTGDAIYVLDDVENPVPRKAASLGRTQTRPSFSADGQWLAFYSNHEESQRFDLYVVDAAGGKPQRIEKGVVLNHDGPTWTPDGELVYVKDDDDAFDPVYRATVHGTPKKVATGTVGNGDLDVVTGTDGTLYLAVAAQGRISDEERSFKRIYVMPLD